MVTSLTRSVAELSWAAALGVKALLRSAAARTVPDLWTAIRHAFAAFRPDEGRNDLTAADYDPYDPT